MLHCRSITRLMSAVIALWQHFLYYKACCATLGLHELCLIALWQHYLTNFSICLIMPLSVHLIVLLYCASLVLQLDTPYPHFSFVLNLYLCPRSICMSLSHLLSKRPESMFVVKSRVTHHDVYDEPYPPRQRCRVIGLILLRLFVSFRKKMFYVVKTEYNAPRTVVDVSGNQESAVLIRGNEILILQRLMSSLWERTAQSNPFQWVLVYSK